MKLLLYILFLVMPNELIVYKLNYTNKKGDDIYLQIRDLKNYDASDPTTAIYSEINLVAGKDALEIETFSTNGTPYGIFGKRAIVSFKSTAEYGMHTFSEGEDGRFDVYAFSTLANQIIFKGFIVMDDNEEEYVPPGTEVKIVATDGLGLLRGVELSDFDGVRPDPDIPVSRIKLLAYCLAKTGLGADIIIQDNLYSSLMQYRSVGGGDEMNNPWDQSWILPNTYEKEVNVYEDCFTVIQKLLGENLRLSYGKLGAGDSAFIVQRVHELKRDTVSYTRFNPSGVAISGVIDDASHIVNIGHADDHPVYFIGRATRVSNRRPAKKVELKYLFDVQKDLPRNKDFTRGTLNIPMSGLNYTAYDPADWEFKRWKPFAVAPDAASLANAYIKKVFEDGYEKERYLVITKALVANPVHWLRCKKHIYVHEKDRINVSVDYRFNGQFNDRLFTFLLAGELRANDGTFYYLYYDPNNIEHTGWLPYQAGTTNILGVNVTISQDSDTKTDWRKITVEDKAGVPKAGVVYLYLGGEDAAGAANQTHFSNLQLEYIPYVNGSYKKYLGERVTDSQTGRYSNPQDNEVHVSVSQKILFKGALLNYDSGTGVITLINDRWFDWTHYHATAETLLDKRLVLVTLDHYNHYRNTQRVFNLNMRGLVDEDDKLCNMCNVYRNSVNNLNNNNKSFVLVSMRQNWSSCAWTGTAVEIDDSGDRFAEAGDYTSEHKYIE